MWTLILVLAVTYFIYYCWTLRPAKFPPGPPMLPFVGAIPFIKLSRIHLFMEEAREKYGPIVGTRLGMRLWVFFCSPKHVFEILKREEFQGRPSQLAIGSNTAKKGIILTEGDFWTLQRRFTLRHLRDFGFGKTSAEGLILEEAEELFENAFYDKTIIQATSTFNISAINVLWTLISGKRYAHDDTNFKVLLNVLDETFRMGGFANGTSFLKRTFLSAIGKPAEIPCEERLINLIKEAIKEHRNNPPDEPRDFIDVYLNAIQGGSDPDFTDLSLISICIDLFSAGAESVGNTLSFCLLYLVLHPDIQEELWQHVDSTLAGRKPLLSDRSILPKIEAFLSEVARINTIAPIPVPRRTLTDVEYEGFLIPEDSFIVLSLWSIFRDKEHWGDPDVFRPWRFLGEDGKYVKDNWLINFGIGKRLCIGESLAKNVMFLFLVRLIQEFRFSIPKGTPPPTTLGQPGFTTTPEPFNVELSRRK